MGSKRKPKWIPPVEDFAILNNARYPKGNRLMRWLKSLFAWHAVRNSGVWLYSENRVTGQRCATLRSTCFQPLDHQWLRNGDIVVGHRGRYVIGTESEIIYG